jgi:hypothetical protein
MMLNSTRNNKHVTRKLNTLVQKLKIIVATQLRRSNSKLVSLFFAQFTGEVFRIFIMSLEIFCEKKTTFVLP